MTTPGIEGSRDSRLAVVMPSSWMGPKLLDPKEKAEVPGSSLGTMGASSGTGSNPLFRKGRLLIDPAKGESIMLRLSLGMPSGAAGLRFAEASCQKGWARGPAEDIGVSCTGECVWHSSKLLYA